MSPKEKILVVAMIVFRQSEVFICRRKKGKSNSGLWEFPGGKMNENESKFDAIIREIDEEFGVGFQPETELGRIETTIDKGGSLELIGIKGVLNEEIRFMTDHDLFQWVPIMEVEQVKDLCPADLLLWKQIKNKVREMEYDKN